ncbi:hypothetical protein N7461_005372 [Penicillium sp. DV-2018c]|nr:hypothetical protein N7461_005372 [Penicillium sp. DV-2018c]
MANSTCSFTPLSLSFGFDQCPVVEDPFHLIHDCLEVLSLDIQVALAELDILKRPDINVNDGLKTVDCFFHFIKSLAGWSRGRQPRCTQVISRHANNSSMSALRLERKNKKNDEVGAENRGGSPPVGKLLAS